MIFKNTHMITLLAIAITGCITVPAEPPKIRSVTINAPKQAIIGALISRMADGGNGLISANDYVAIFGRKDTSFSGMLEFGSSYDRIPEARTSFSFADTSAGVKVIATSSMVTNPGSAFERVADTSAIDGDNLQATLESLKADIENSPSAEKTN